MAIAGILTLFGLLIAAYSLLKKHEKLLIKIRLSVFDKFLLIIFTIIIFFGILISDYFRDFTKEINLFNFPFKISFLISTSAYLVLFSLIVYIGIKIRINPLKRKKLKLFQELVEELLHKKDYSVLIEILNAEYKRLIKFENKMSLFNSIKQRLLSFFQIQEKIILLPGEIKRIKEILEETENEVGPEEEKKPKPKKIKLFFNKLLIKAKHYLGRFIRIFYKKVRDKNQELARYLLNLLLTNRDFISKLIEFRPELGLKILEHEFSYFYDYADIYFYELVKNNRSILYYEIKNNQNISTKHRYSLKEENVLLNFLFRDCKIARKLEVIRGFGNFINDYLDDLNKQENDPYNDGYENFDETKWNSPIFVGIRFFDIMISEAMHQGIEWEYPIFYFRIFTEKILKNFKVIEEVWKEPHEWNSRYTYLLYEIVSTLEDLVFWIKHSEFSYPIELKKDDHDLEGGNVVKSSIIYLIEILDLIAASENVPDRFKHYLVDIVLRLLFELRTSISEESKRYSNIIFNCIKDHMVKYREFNRSFYELIRKSYDKFDKIHYTASASERSNLARGLDTEIKEYLTTIFETNL